MTIQTRVGSADSGTASIQFAGGGAIPTSTLHIRPIPMRVAQGFVRQHHYLHRANPGHRISFGIFADSAPVSRLIGVAVWGRPVAANRLKDGESLLELYRFVILDCTAPYAESRALGYMARWVRRNLSDVAGLIAYSDVEGMGHRGTIYKAAGWTADGIAGGASWKTRNDGTDRRDTGSLTGKLRWRKPL
jgi:hypothetical protein